ncbi:amino acid adenylation domain-containing protein, partial [Chitinophaga sp. RAB17]|uniref:amino acid adenylation domain-containing protein n=1 Tax=Chitinophaga sp. RAB17 TaxID=3233049 RepID=UPI003F918A96
MFQQMISLHPAQHDIFMDQLIYPDSSHYNTGGYLKIVGTLDKEKFAAAVYSLPAVFDALRMRFSITDDTPHLYFDNNSLSYHMQEVDATDMPDNNAAMELWIKDRLNIPFKLGEEALLYEFYLIRISDQEHWWYFKYHHLVTDGVGVAAVFQYLAKKYNALATGVETNFSFPSYKEEAIRAHTYWDSEDYVREGVYWKARIGEKPDSVLKKRQGAAHQKQGGTYLLDIAADDKAWMDELEKRSGVNLQQLTIAALMIYFAKSTSQTSFVFGVPLHKRRTKQLRTIAGMFMGVIPFKGVYQPDIPLLELLKQIASTQREDYRYQNYLVSDLKKMMQIGHINDYLIEVIVNYALLDMELEMEGNIKATTTTLSNPDLSFPLELMWKDYGKQQPIQLRMDYQEQFFSAEEMPLLARRLMHILRQFKNGLQDPVGQISILPEEEHRLLATYNDTAVAYPNDKTWLDLFAAQVARTPDAVAVVFKEAAISYRQLDERSNQLAHYLQSQGVKEETLVPVCLERSEEMITGILGILKAGGAYVPIDPDYPAERIRYMLTDTGASIVLTTMASALRLQLADNIRVITLDGDNSSIATYPRTAPPNSLTPASLAYVIYTSGTTGQPKGVMNEHGGLLNRLLWTQDYFNLDSTDAVLQKNTFCFDVSVWELLWPLITGARLVFALPEEHRNADYLKGIIVREGITTIHFVPSMLHVFLENIATGDCSCLRRVLCSGEPLLPQQVQAFKQTKIPAGLYNLYGPTEAAIDVTCWPAPEDSSNPEIVPIGKPVANTTLYILDTSGNITPIGVPGELHIGGIQVARGYLNRPELTAQRFFNNPFLATGHTRMYRTGDQARWLPDGNIEYLGRKDDQVKIRGYRIELGEIESLLLQCELVSQAVVVPRKDNQGLIGYVVPRGDFDKSAILVYLQSKLPGYMVPSFLIPLDELPLGTNGKIDKKALPPVDMNVLLEEDYVAPRNEREQTLAAIWEELLGVSRVGIYDNFFELGGDSIITIQLVSRARRAGYALQPRDLFACQTIAALSSFLLLQEHNTLAGEQGLLTGTSGLLPIQQFYFETTGNTSTHFNQSVLLKVTKATDADKLSMAIAQLVRHHDALRFGYTYSDGIWKQSYGNYEAPLEIFDLHDVAPAALPSAIAAKEEQYQRSLHIEKGILFRAVLLLTPEEEEDHRLLLIVHHLAVDGVSWRILLEDVVLLLNAEAPEMNSILGHKGSSYRQWYNVLENYSRLPHLLNQQSYWEKIAGKYSPLRVEHTYDGNIATADVDRLEVRLDAVRTQRLLQDVPKAYHTEINDILLSALALTLNVWNNSRSVVVGVEGHGREDIAAGIDNSRTVGWFTSMYPVVLEVQTDDKSALIKEVKEQLRKVTDKGIGYGVLKYINKVPSLQGNNPWDVLFNYLGQLDSLLRPNDYLSASMESLHAFASEAHPVQEKIIIDSYIQDGVLVLNWRYSTRHYSMTDIEKLASDYLSNLQMLIAHCASQQVVSFTPADYGLGAYINHEALDKFLDVPYKGVPRRQQITGLYRLSGLQEGILFHSLYNQQSDVYLEQLTCDLGALNETILLQGLQHLVQQHTILRSVFYYDEFSVPVQCVLREVKLPVTVLDYRQLKENEQLDAISQYEATDRRQGFDFSEAPLTRFCLIRLKDDHYRLLWTFHHILLDGWSLPVLLAELLQYYETVTMGSRPVITTEDRFEDFIRFVDRQDKAQSLQYWGNYLNRISEGSLLPFIGTVAGRTKGLGVYREHLLQLDTIVSDRLTSYARRHRITQNTLMQGVWSYLLSRYTGRRDIIFGITVAGRPEELPGMEQRVGMFINTLPLHTTVEPENDIVAWLQQLQVNQQECGKYQYTGLKDIQQSTGITGDLFDTSITFQNYPLNSVLALKDWQLKMTNLEAHPHTNYPLTIIIHTGETTRLLFSYNSDLLDTFYVQQIAAQFHHVLLQVIENEVKQLNDIELLTTAERELLLSANNHVALAGTDQTIVDMFAAVVARTPQATALVFEGQSMSYEELDARATRLAVCLRQNGVEANTLVPLFIERSADMVVGILGILKAGGAYVPVEQDYPIERISYILKDAAATVIVSSSSCRGLLPSTAAQVISLDEDLLNDAGPVLPHPSASQLLYVIYTSGSTGAPKGVMITHRNLSDYLAGLQAAIPIADCHSFALLTGIATDLGNTVLYGCLATGGELHLFPKAFINDSDKLHDYFNSHRIDCIKVVPSYWKAVSAPDKLLLPEQLLIFGGEAL